MKNILFVLVILSNLAFAGAPLRSFPTAPDVSMTPGKLCEHADQRRYPEQIAYCLRNVLPATKDAIFESYKRAGFTFPGLRGAYKIDHLVPLCAGGSNSTQNLWPQHESLFTRTDSIEALGCEKLALGLITQAKLVKIVVDTKLHIESAQATYDYLYRL